MFLHTAPKAIRELDLGGSLVKSKAGSREAVINAKKNYYWRANRHGLITSRDFGGTKNGELVIQQML